MLKIMFLVTGMLVGAFSANAESFKHLLDSCKVDRAALDAEIKAEGTETLEKLIRATKKSLAFGSVSACFDRRLKIMIESRPSSRLGG